jgi:hypothetical protein
VSSAAKFRRAGGPTENVPLEFESIGDASTVEGEGGSIGGGDDDRSTKLSAAINWRQSES